MLLRTPMDFESNTMRDISDLRIKIIDFGSATYEDEHKTKVINTRQYRAPEVIIGQEWDCKSDIWGIACIALELYTGELYFSTHESYEHLAMIEKRSGINLFHAFLGFMNLIFRTCTHQDDQAFLDYEEALQI